MFSWNTTKWITKHMLSKCTVRKKHSLAILPFSIQFLSESFCRLSKFVLYLDDPSVLRQAEVEFWALNKLETHDSNDEPDKENNPSVKRRKLCVAKPGSTKQKDPQTKPKPKKVKQ